MCVVLWSNVSEKLGGGEMGYILFLSGVSVTNFYIFTALKHIC